MISADARAGYQLDVTPLLVRALRAPAEAEQEEMLSHGNGRVRRGWRPARHSN